MCTYTKLKDHLQEISQDARFIKFDYESPEKFHVLLKCEVNPNETAAFYNNYVKEWINKFSAFTHTAWIVRNSFPNMKRIAYKKYFLCHRSAHNKRKASLKTQSLHCEAKIEFKVKHITKNSMKSDPYLQEGLCMNISIVNDHSHAVRQTVALDCLTKSSESDAMFYEYFNDGYSAIAAKCYHELRLIEAYGLDSEKLANPNINPKLDHVVHLHKQCWTPRLLNMNELIIKRIKTLEEIGHTIRYSENPPFVVILTPLMKRVISQIGVEQVLVDTTRESNSPFTIFLYVPSMVGSLPIACVIFTERSAEAIYLQIFLTIKLAIESECDIIFAPQLILHDSSKLKQAFSSIFPNAILKFSHYFLCRDIWRWIFCDQNNVTHENKHKLMVLFKSLINAKSLKVASMIYGGLVGSQFIQPCLVKFQDIWASRDDWLESGASEKFNDAPIACMKEFILQQCQLFNLCAMVDVVTNVIEGHYQKILLSHANGNATSLYTKFLAKIKIDPSADCFKNEYSLLCTVNKTECCQLNMDTLCCECRQGKTGRLCEHLCGMLNAADHDFVSLASLTEHEKNKFLKIVGDDDYTINQEKELHFFEINKGADDDDISMSSSSSKESYELEIKEEVEQDPLEENNEDDTREDVSKVELNEQYETAMKSLNDQFQRLNNLFKNNPNQSNLATMQQLAEELSKILVVDKADLSNIFESSHRTS